MIEYDLSEIAKPKKDTRLPKLEQTMTAYYAYLRELRLLLSGINKEINRELATYLSMEKAALGTDSAALILDVGPTDFTRLDSVTAFLTRIASASVRRILGLEAKRHTKTFMEQVKRALGVDLAAVVREEDLETYLDAAAERNAQLITNLGQDTVTKVKRTVIDAVIRGQNYKDTQQQIVQVMQTSDSRAKLIARDQTAKLNSDLNKIRHQQAGIESYIWVTSHDERVRPRHRKLDGVPYRYDEKTGAEDGLPPGQPIQCRCIAQPVVEGF